MPYNVDGRAKLHKIMKGANMKKTYPQFMCRVIFLIAVVCAFALSSCETDDPVDGIDVDQFSITVDADTTMGVVGQTFVITTRVSAGEPFGGLTYSWDFSDSGSPSADAGSPGETAVFSFTGPGTFMVQVTATDVAGNSATAGAQYQIYEAAEKQSVGTIEGGDVITAADVERLEDYLNGMDSLTADQIAAADVNLDGYIDQNDVELLRAAIGDTAPTYFSADNATIGTSVLVIHPALTDQSAVVTLGFDTTAAGTWDAACQTEMQEQENARDILFLRSRPGYLVFTIPPAYSCLTSAETANVVMLVTSGGLTTVITLKEGFRLEPLPQVTGTPGDLVLDALATMQSSLATMEDGLSEYAETLAADTNERAALVGLMQAAREIFDEQYEEFVAGFDELDDTTRQAWDQMAKARGMDSLTTRMRQERVRMEADIQRLRDSRRMSTSTGQALISLICGFKTMINLSGQVSDINDEIAGYLEYVDYWPVNRLPVVGPVITFLSGVSQIIAAATDIISTVGEYVPQLNDKIDTEADPKELWVGDSTKITAGISVNISSGLCNKVGGEAVDDITSKIKEQLTKRIASNIPIANKYFKAAKYSTDNMSWIVSKIYDVVGSIAGAIVDASGLQGYMSSLAKKFCDLFSDPVLPLDTAFLEASCGTLSNGLWTCVDSCIGNTTFSGEKDICGNDIPASALVECKANTTTTSSSSSSTSSSSTTTTIENKQCKCYDSGVTFTVISDNGMSPDCGEASYCVSMSGTGLIDDGKIMSDPPYCTMQINCP